MLRRIFIVSLITISIIMSIGILVFRTGVGHADNTTPSPTPTSSMFSSGTWQGQGAFQSGHSVFDMTLTLNITNSTFLGDMRSAAVSSEATVNGAISSTFGDIIGITFVPSQIIQGTQFQLGTVYSATVTGGRIRGSWTTQGQTNNPIGTFTLNQVPGGTPAANPSQTPAQPPTPTQPPTSTQPPTPSPTNQTNYVPSGDGQQATVTTVLTWYGFDDNSGQTEQQHGSADISYPRNAGNPTLHNQATEGSGTFDDPITAAARDNDRQTFPVGSVIYVPLTHKYYIMEDTCGDTSPEGCLNGAHHVDLWMGPPNASGNALTNCEDENTPGTPVPVIINPSPSLPIDITSEFRNGQCTLHTYAQ